MRLSRGIIISLHISPCVDSEKRRQEQDWAQAPEKRGNCASASTSVSQIPRRRLARVVERLLAPGGVVFFQYKNRLPSVPDSVSCLPQIS